MAKFIIGKKEFKTERGILAFVQRQYPTAHEVIMSCGDILLMRHGIAMAILPGSDKRCGRVFAHPRFIK